MNEWDSVVVGIVVKSKLLDLTQMLVSWSSFSMLRNSIILADNALSKI